MAGLDSGLTHRRAATQRVVGVLSPPADDIELRQLSAAEAAVASLAAPSAAQLAFASTQLACVPAGHGDVDGEHVENGSSLWRCEVIQVGRDDVSVASKPGEAPDIGGVASASEQVVPVCHGGVK